MIYVSSSSVRNGSIKESVLELVRNDIYNIELTGGTKYYDDYINDLKHLQDKYNINYQLHNYFPPPSEDFILNLASGNSDIYLKSIEHCKKAINLSKSLGCEKYGVHAGFLIDFTVEEVGKKIKYRKLIDREQAKKRFIRAWEELRELAEGAVQLYLENNVLSATNFSTYGQQNPFFLTDYDSFVEIKELTEFNLLLDLAHLKVSINSLGLNFHEEASQLLQLTDYIHISGNDGLHDQNLGLLKDLEMIELLKKSDLTGKTITLEIYDGLESVKQSLEVIQALV